MRIPLATFCFLLSLALEAQDYPLLYENGFENNPDIGGFEFTDLNTWRVLDTLGNSSLDLFGKSEYKSRVRSPFNIAILKDIMVGSFILEVDLKQTGREYGHRDMCLFFGFNNATNFYYTHIATKADPNAHNIFIVNDEPRVNIGAKTTEGVNWGSDWQKVRLERNITDGSIRVFFNDMKVPVMEATDNHFTAGYIGFGSFDDTGRVDNIKLWGEQVEPKKGFFR